LKPRPAHQSSGNSQASTAPIEKVSTDPRIPHEVWYPIEDWSDEDVFAYLRSVGVPVARYCEHKAQERERATCPAFWPNRPAGPDLSVETYMARLRLRRY
jgi:3'-phosphoadenosine 5'-phosphosulfate sulfotransferase (PAPS reductase)/FAD synthetase